MDFKIDDDRKIKFGTPMKTEVLDYEFYEPANNINVVDTNLEKVNCAKEEKEFEEESQELEDIVKKSENCIINSDLDKKKCIIDVCKKSLSENHMCPICEKSFSHKTSLNRHLHLHNGVKKYKCEICEKLFNRKGNLKTHLLLHTREKNCKCYICEKSFDFKSALNTHLLLHTGVKNYKCDICEKLFALKSTLNTHLFFHTGETNYKCDICEKSFSQKSYLKTHVLLHTGERNFKCDICEKSFSQKSSLRTHLILHTGKKNKSDICKKLFSLSHKLKNHEVNCCKEDFKIDEKQEIKCKDGIKTEVLDYESHEQIHKVCEYSNVDMNVSNLDYKSETVEKLNCVKDENDGFEEELHDLY